MEIFNEDDEEIKKLMIRISKKEITLCETCDAFFDYVPQKYTCDECKAKRKREYVREYNQRPEVKERERKRRRKYAREYYQRPEVKERECKRKRERYQRPEVKERIRKYRQRPEERERRREYQRKRYLRLKKLREEE